MAKVSFETYKDGVLISSDPVGADVEEIPKDKLAKKLEEIDLDKVKTLPEAVAALKQLRALFIDFAQRV